jgi:hypothetical protein
MNKPLADRRLLVCVLTLFAMCAVCRAEDKVKIEFKVKPPTDTPADAKLYLAGNNKEFGGEWKADGLQLKKQDDGTYTASVSVPKGATLEYKITRGGWETVEKKSDGSEIDNRKYTAEKDDSVTVEVAKWAK